MLSTISSVVVKVSAVISFREESRTERKSIRVGILGINFPMDFLNDLNGSHQAESRRQDNETFPNIQMRKD